MYLSPLLYKYYYFQQIKITVGGRHFDAISFQKLFINLNNLEIASAKFIMRNVVVHHIHMEVSSD